jgi:hypothetical protein
LPCILVDFAIYPALIFGPDQFLCFPKKNGKAMHRARAKRAMPKNLPMKSWERRRLAGQEAEHWNAPARRQRS